jgi:hypothetical protein
MTAASLATFMAATDATLRDLFPATVRIAGVEYAAAGVGGSALNSYLEGGRVEEGRRFFRIAKSLLARPAPGATLEWLDATGAVSRFTVMEVPDRPQETSWMLACDPFLR